MKVPTNRITQSVIIGLATLVATISWSGLKEILENQENYLLAGLSFFVLLIFLSLNWLLTSSRAVLLTTIFFILISFFLSFGFKPEYLTVLFLAFLLFWSGSQLSIKEKNVRLKIKVIRILRRGLPLVTSGLALVMATAFYFSPLAAAGQNEINIPRSWFNFIMEPLNQADQFEDLLYQTANQRVNKYSQSYQAYFPFGLSIGIFLSLKAIGYFFSWLVILTSWLVFKILVAVGAIKIQEQAVLKEVIEI